MEENNYVVYRHTSPSSKIYIGITCQKPEYRWGKDGKRYKNSHKFYNAIQKYGWTNFKHEILYSGLNEISAKLIEEDLIYYYKSLNISYNITDGGDGTKGITPSEETRKKMSNSRKNIMKENPAIIKNIINYNSKSISQYSKDGRFINTYNSIMEAERDNNISNSHISECCRGLRKTAGGFIWRFNQ